MSKPVQFRDWPESLGVPYGPYRAVIERAADGDTVHVGVSPGLGEYALARDPHKELLRPRAVLRSLRGEGPRMNSR